MLDVYLVGTLNPCKHMHTNFFSSVIIEKLVSYRQYFAFINFVVCNSFLALSFARSTVNSNDPLYWMRGPIRCQQCFHTHFS